MPFVLMLPAVAEHSLRVGPLPAWLDAERLLGPLDDGRSWTFVTGEDGSVEARGRTSTAVAADLAARLRGLGFDGRPLSCDIEPPLRRPAVRKARADDARRRRATTPGFERPGARVDDVGRVSLTPERLAVRMAGWADGRTVVDAGCGVGGNAIAFARAGSRVIAIEADAARLELARHNAAVYGVGARIEFVHGDAIELVPRHAGADRILFVDPPWGVEWDRGASTIDELPLLAALVPLAHGYAELWAKLPPSCAIGSLLAGVAGGRVDAMFGEAEGDRRRVKFVLVRRPT